jgi:threonyl-tRNA synthetase
LVFSVVSQTDYANLETCAKNAIKEKQQFVRLEMKKEELLEMFKVSWPCLDLVVFGSYPRIFFGGHLNTTD